VVSGLAGMFFYMVIGADGGIIVQLLNNVSAMEDVIEAIGGFISFKMQYSGTVARLYLIGSNAALAAYAVLLLLPQIAEAKGSSDLFMICLGIAFCIGVCMCTCAYGYNGFLIMERYMRRPNEVTIKGGKRDSKGTESTADTLESGRHVINSSAPGLNVATSIVPGSTASD